MSEYQYGIFIGRFQPVHDGHLAVFNQALSESKSLIVLIGSARATQDTKNPFSYEERTEMISLALGAKKDGNKAITPSGQTVWFVPIRDYFYNENMWITEVQYPISKITNDDHSVALYGSYKDSSSYYINLFPQWDFRPTKMSSTLSSINATDIRNSLFSGIEEQAIKNVPEVVAKWIKENLTGERLQTLKDEYDFIVNYKNGWTTPYPVTFVTTDAVVIKSGHVLVIKRKFAPGKGLLALPGGFLKYNKPIEDSMMAELKEETRIKVAVPELRRAIIGSRVFDYPSRDPRGRTITHAFHIDLGSGELPEVKGGDDAKKAQWIPLIEALQNENQFYSDHWHIIYHFMQDRRFR